LLSEICGISLNSGNVSSDRERRCKALELRLVELNKEESSRHEVLDSLVAEREQLCAEKEEVEKLSDSTKNRSVV
jgi:hypothetical protein